MVDDAGKKIAEGLLAAIKAESDGYSFYMMAARSTEDEQGREVFEQLAAEELDHKRFLSAQYRSFLETGKASVEAKLGPRRVLEGDSPIFSRAIKTRLKDAHFEMSALSIGMQLELSAQKYYRSMADGVSDDDTKSFFNELADWEAGHYAALSAQQETLKEDYWAASGFSPL